MEFQHNIQKYALHKDTGIPRPSVGQAIFALFWSQGFGLERKILPERICVHLTV